MPGDSRSESRVSKVGLAGETLKTAAAFAAGAYAVRRFQPVPLGVQRQTLEIMQRRYARTNADRGIVLPQFPPLMRMGRNACLVAAQSAGSGCPRSTLEAFEGWPEPIETAAHEVLENEGKFRSLLWAIVEVEHARGIEAPPPGMDESVFKAIDAIVRHLNDFAQMVELGLFAETDVFGLLHRSIAPVCKAIEPVIWCRNVSGGRWGLRLLRLRLRAEHFNDVRAIHSSSPLLWTAKGMDPVCIHEALYRPVFDRLVPSERLRRMPADDRLRLEWEARATRIRPRFGGVRLRRHIAAENQLASRLRYAREHGLDPLDFSWSLQSVSDGLRRVHEQSGDAAAA